MDSSIHCRGPYCFQCINVVLVAKTLACLAYKHVVSTNSTQLRETEKWCSHQRDNTVNLIGNQLAVAQAISLLGIQNTVFPGEFPFPCNSQSVCSWLNKVKKALRLGVGVVREQAPFG